MEDKDESPFDTMLDVAVVSQGQADGAELALLRAEFDKSPSTSSLPISSLSLLSGFLTRLGHPNPSIVSISRGDDDII